MWSAISAGLFAIIVISILSAIIVCVMVAGKAEPSKEQPRDSKGRFTKRND